MSEVELPTDWEELGELIESGEMAEGQISASIASHGHLFTSCSEVCYPMWYELGSTPLELILENYDQTLTLGQRNALHETFSTHMHTDDYLNSEWRGLIQIASGPSADLALLSNAHSHVEALIVNYRDGNLSEEIRGFLFRFADNVHCTEQLLTQTVRSFHQEVLVENHECSQGAFENCDFCQNMVEEAVGKLKR